MTEINNTLFMALIKGLKYNDNTKDYTFKHKKYKLADIKSDEKRKNTELYYFVNINEPTDLKIVKVVGGIPSHDGFNEVKIDTKLRKIEYQRKYYEKVTSEKRKAKRQQAKAERVKKQEKERAKKIKELQSITPKAKYEPIKCAYCGVEFTPHAKNQRFHTDECRKRYFSEKQAQAEKQSREVEKVCPICNTVFTGTPRDIYCSPDCFKVAQKSNRKARYERDKQNGLYDKGGKYEYKAVEEKPKKKAIVVKKSKNVK